MQPITLDTVTGSKVTFPIKEPRLIFGAIITSTAATYFLETSSEKFQNRSIPQDRVNEFGTDMKSGRWKHNGETIKFNKEGILVDGYTRCTASFEHEVNFITDVRTGIEDDAVQTIDTGRPRSLANALSMAGITDKTPNALAQGLTWLYKYDHNIIHERWRRISHGDSIEFLKQHPTLQESVVATAAARNKRLASPGVLVAAHYICTKASVGKAHDFFEMLSTGVGYSSTSPVRHLREKLMARSTARAKADEQFAWILHAWNKYVAGDQMRVLKLPNEMPQVKGYDRKQEKIKRQAEA